MLSDPAAERAVLASIYHGGGEAYADIDDIVTSKTFTVDSNQYIWAAFEHACKDEPRARIDLPTILSAAKSLGVAHVFDRPEELQHLRAVLNFPARAENGRKLAAKIRKLEIARLLNDQLDVAKHDVCSVTGDETIDQILAKAENPVFDFTTLLAQTSQNDTKKMGDGLEEYLTHLMDNPRDMVGISTGFRRYDVAIGGGLRENSLDVIGAPKKSGKSFLSDAIGLHISCKQNIPVLNLDTEMSWEEHGHRVAANLSGVPIDDIERGICTRRPEHKNRVLEGARMLRDKPYHYRCILKEEFEETLSHMRRWVLRDVGLQANGKAKPCVIIYDYLKMMSAAALSKGDLTEWQMLGFIATTLKNFAGRYGVAILAFAQLNRENDIASSDRIRWFCTSYSTYRWKTEEEIAEDGHGYTHMLIPELSRRGKGLRNGDYINVKARYEIARIEEGPTKRELEHDTTVQGGEAVIIVDGGVDGEVQF